MIAFSVSFVLTLLVWFFIVLPWMARGCEEAAVENAAKMAECRRFGHPVVRPFRCSGDRGWELERCE